jgi:uncharacterized membrane protein
MAVTATATNQDKASEATAVGGRIMSIDVLRGFALCGMVLVHFADLYGNAEAAENFITFFFNDMLADWGAAAFLMMMGISQVLSARRMEKPDNRLLFKRALLRGSYLFAVGLLMLLLAFGPGRMWRWDILTLMGFATVVLFFCRFLPSWSLVVLSGAIAVLTPVIRSAFNIAAEWGGGFEPTPFISNYLPGLFIDPVSDYVSVWNLEKIIKGFFLSGYFPVLPWVMFPITGLVLGRRIIQGKLRRDLPVLLLTGFLLLCLGVGLGLAGRARPDISVVNHLVSPLCFYPDSFSMINVQAGMSLIVFSIMYFFCDVRKRDKSKMGIWARLFTRTSNFSLTFYFLHYMLLGWPLLIIYLFTGRYLYEDMMGAVPALFCGVGAVAILEFLIYFWEKADSKYSLEAILGALTARIVPGYKRSIRKTTGFGRAHVRP